MDCTSNNSAQLEQDAVDHNNVQLVDVHVTGDGDAAGGGGVKNDDDVDVEVERINKATTSGNNSSNNSKTGQKEEEEHVEMSNENNEAMTAMQPSSPTMMITKMIVKGKRTKRQRLRSPIIHNNTSSQEDADEEAEDEEQLDMANCLILLAQGQSRSPVITGNELSLRIRKRCYSSSATGVYECKTCNRTFPSFQALGGHRASHKKLNITPIISPLVTVASSSSPLFLQLGNINYARPPPTPTPILVQTNNSSKSRSKSHECAICGSEFSSGQALGGHMRRHRGQVLPRNSSTTTTTTTATNNIANTTLSLSPAPIAVESSSAAAGKVDRINTGNDGFLSLDLNLPASPENHDQAKFSSFNPKQPQPQPQQQSAMVFPTPAMVDCFF